MNLIGLMFSLAALASFAAAPAAQAGPLQYARDPSSKLPFSDAVRAGDFLYVSGQIGIGAGSTPELAFQSAAHSAMDHIGQILTAHGSSFDHVVQCSVMLADMKTWPAFNQVYITYFKPERLPARNAFGANGLAQGAPLEVTCFAYEGASQPG